MNTSNLIFGTLLGLIINAISVQGQSLESIIPAGTEKVVCKNSYVQLTYEAEEGFEYKWYPDSVFLNTAICLMPNPWTLPLKKTTDFTLLVKNKEGIELPPIHTTAIIQDLKTNLDTYIHICPNDTVRLKASPSGGSDYRFFWKYCPDSEEVIDTTQNLVVAPNHTTFFKLIVTDKHTGCTSEGHAHVFVDELYEIKIISTYSSICQKSSKFLGNGEKKTGDSPCAPISTRLFAGTGIHGYSYLWSTGQTSDYIEVDKIGMYSVTVTKDGGCSTTANYEVDDCLGMRFNMIKTGDGRSFISANPTEMIYEWQDGSTDQFHEIKEAGTYTVTIVDTLTGCEAFDQVAFDNSLMDSILRIDVAELQATENGCLFAICPSWLNYFLNEIDKAELEKAISGAILLGRNTNYEKVYSKWSCDSYKYEEAEYFRTKKQDKKSLLYSLYFKKSKGKPNCYELVYKAYR